MENRNKHILLFNRSFWPDVEATGQFLTELCEQLVKKYRITVIAGRSYYVEKETFGIGRLYKREVYKGIEILRVRHTRFWKKHFMGRIINWFTYSMLAFIISLRVKPDIVVACTDPPFLGTLAMLISRLKSITFIYNCRDLFPDVPLQLGELKPGLASSIFDYLNRKALYAASAVVCLGQSMKNRLSAKGVCEGHISVISDWADTSMIKPIPKSDNPLLKQIGLANKFIIMYSGNIGLSQDLGLILHSLTMVEDHSSFYLVFIGDGTGKENLRHETQSLGLKNVLFLPYQPLNTLSFSLSMADLHLVPLKKGMAGAIVPSKVYGIIAAGRPYLAVADKESEPARLATEFGCGLWTSPEDARMIAETLEWSLNHTHKLEEMGRRGRQIAEQRFDKHIVIGEWFELLDSLIGS